MQLLNLNRVIKRVLCALVAANCIIGLAHAMQSAGSAQESKAVVSAERSATEQEQLNKAFYDAVSKREFEKARALYGRGADVNYRDSKWGTPLWSMASMAVNAGAELPIQFLLSLPGIEVNKLGDDAKPTALDVALHGSCIDFLLGNSLKQIREKVVKLLLAHGADPYIKNKDGQNAIERLAEYPDVVKLLTGGRTAYLAEQERIRKQLVEERRDVIAEIAQLPRGVAAIAAGLAVDEAEIAACLQEERKMQREEETKKQ